ncbi:MAG TPA: tetratricopeptide repeat protein [Thermoplasmata archaeon]|nr:tetratricopeptide repeat protein [Thermoplasmata archaeon]
MSQQFDIGVHYLLKGEYEHALRMFQEVTREEPHNARAWAFLGTAHAHLGQAPEAEAALSKAVGLGPQNSEAWFHLGVARSLRGEWADAATAYRHAVALDPADLVAWHRLGVALAESGEESQATAAFERALVLSRETGDRQLEEPVPRNAPDDHLAEAGEREGGREAESWLDLALQLLSLGDEEEAMAAYDRAYTLDPKRAQGSLFRPMLQLVQAAAEAPLLDEDHPEVDRPAGPEPPPQGPIPQRRNDRPEVA